MIPKKNPWDITLNSLDKFSEDFMEFRNQPEIEDIKEDSA